MTRLDWLIIGGILALVALGIWLLAALIEGYLLRRDRC